MSNKQIVLLVIVGLLLTLFFLFDLNQYFSLEYVKSQQAVIHSHFQANPVQTAVGFFLLYIVVTGLSLPGAAVMTLVAGAIFGLAWGTLLVSFASTIGATIAFLVSRYLLRDSVQSRFGDKLKAINEGIERDGGFYLFGLRLVPAFPFFVINLAMGLTPLKVSTFFLVSQAGMLAGTIVYVNAGTQLARLDSLSGILSPGLILSFVLLGLFPLIAKWVLNSVSSRRVARQ